eukprot:SAG22_NODE_2229_length_2812_cov_4.603022_3_plen_81_part_00
MKFYAKPADTFVMFRHRTGGRRLGKTAGRKQHRSSPAGSALAPLDYKEVITERSFAKDWKPKNPLGQHQRMRNVVAYANR